MYKILRPTLWFCENDEVEKEKFNSYFTQEGLTQLIKYGFIEEIH